MVSLFKMSVERKRCRFVPISHSATRTVSCCIFCVFLTLSQIVCPPFSFFSLLDPSFFLFCFVFFYTAAVKLFLLTLVVCRGFGIWLATVMFVLLLSIKDNSASHLRRIHFPDFVAEWTQRSAMFLVHTVFFLFFFFFSLYRFFGNLVNHLHLINGEI